MVHKEAQMTHMSIPGARSQRQTGNLANGSCTDLLHLGQAGFSHQALRDSM